MNADEYRNWFRKLAQEWNSLKKKNSQGDPRPYFDLNDGSQWVSKAGTAIQSLFPANHFIVKQWERQMPGLKLEHYNGGTMLELHGVFSAALDLINDGKLDSIILGIRREAESDLLDQANTLLTQNHLAAAAVIAGGALETHLKQLVENNGLSIAGEGSISKYNGAIGQARNSVSIELYNSTDSNQVVTWGSLRNEAAHSPGAFNRSAAEVRLMIDGIRNFISRI